MQVTLTLLYNLSVGSGLKCTKYQSPPIFDIAAASIEASSSPLARIVDPSEAAAKQAAKQSRMCSRPLPRERNTTAKGTARHEPTTATAKRTTAGGQQRPKPAPPSPSSSAMEGSGSGGVRRRLFPNCHGADRADQIDQCVSCCVDWWCLCCALLAGTAC